MFPLDRWYVGALSSELSAEVPLGRQLLGQKLVFFRDPDGRAVALEDRCVHRSLPLSMGCVESGRLRCGYHGLLFDATGRCVEIPGQAEVPPRAVVRHYVVQEQQGLLWVWFGRTADAVPDRDAPEWAPLADPVYRVRGASFRYRAPWQLIHDNLLDLTHTGYVHTRTIGGNPRMHSEAPTDVSLDGDTVRVQRGLSNSVAPATFLDAWPFDGPIDRWQQIEFKVSHVTIRAGGVETGRADLSLPPEQRGGLQLPSFHAVTPETADTSHYLWMVGCNSTREGVMEGVYEQFSATFLEDKVVIEAQQENLLQFPDAPRISAHFDRAPTMARRIVDRLAQRD